jgi:hypothetical protein
MFERRFATVPEILVVFRVGEVIEAGDTEQTFPAPRHRRTQDDMTGWMGYVGTAAHHAAMAASHCPGRSMIGLRRPGVDRAGIAAQRHPIA